MNAREYFQRLQRSIDDAAFVVSVDLHYNEIDTNECYIRGRLILPDSLELHIAEYVVTAPTFQRLKYRYHLQTVDGTLVSRWDNAPHYPKVSTFPHHRHDASESAYPSPPISIPDVLDMLPSLFEKFG